MPAKPEIFVYRGYRLDADGEKVAVLFEETGQQTFLLRKGRKFRGLMLFDFSSHQITFMNDRGKTKTLGPEDKLTYYPPGTGPGL